MSERLASGAWSVTSGALAIRASAKCVDGWLHAQRAPTKIREAVLNCMTRLGA